MGIVASYVIFAAFVLGLSFGSFLNVCIARLPEHRSVVAPRSACPRCGHLIRWYDNFPVLSFLILRGTCRDCGARIPWRYPLVEIAVGLWFAFCTLRLVLMMPQVFHLQFAERIYTAPAPWWVISSSIEYLILGFFLIGLLVMDWRTHTLPDAFTLTGTAVGFALTCVQAFMLPLGVGDIHLHPSNNLRMASPGSMAASGDVFMTGPEAMVLERLGLILLAAGIIVLLRWTYKKLRGHEGMGLGDAKLMALLAAFLGWQGALFAFFIGIVSCAAYAVTLLARRRADLMTRLPLGTFLCIGGLCAVVFGGPLMRWYGSLF